MKKVLIVHGSPRKQGNGHAIVDSFCEVFDESVDVTTYELAKRDVKGCMACFACKRDAEQCSIKDDLSEVLNAVHETDVLVLVAPVYFGDVSAQMKAFIDRLYHLFLPNYHEAPLSEEVAADSMRISRLRKGVELVFITTQGSVDPALFSDINPRYGHFFRWLGFDKVHHIRGIGESIRHEANHTNEVFSQARELAVKLIA